MCYTHRRLMSMLVNNLIEEGDIQRAKNVLDRAEKEIPAYNVPHDYQSGSLDLARGYQETGQNKKAQELLDELWKKSYQYMQWYCSLDATRFANSQRDCMINLYIMNQMLNLQDKIDPKKSEKMEKQLQGISELYYAKGGTFAE